MGRVVETGKILKIAIILSFPPPDPSPTSAAHLLALFFRMIQGEMTSTEDVDVIRYGLREETDMRVCLLNYRKNGTAFLNQFNLSPLRDTSGKLVRQAAASWLSSRRLGWLQA